jgi:hypothetical protein
MRVFEGTVIEVYGSAFQPHVEEGLRLYTANFAFSALAAKAMTAHL